MGIWADEGWLYLAALLDTYSRFMVGWAMSVYRDETLVTEARRNGSTIRSAAANTLPMSIWLS
jgi:transposase InsO family protein